MAHSTRAADSLKARKLHKISDALTLRKSDGRWRKHYKNQYGEWRWWYFRGTEPAAIDECNTVKADLLAGREPDTKPSSGVVTLAELVNAFLHHKEQLLNSGEVAPITWQVDTTQLSAADKSNPTSSARYILAKS